MDKKEALDVLQQKLASYRQYSYGKLMELMKTSPWSEEVTGPSGSIYYIECQVLWDDKTKGHIRVLGAISGYSWWSDFVPSCASFIMAPGGSFIGE